MSHLTIIYIFIFSNTQFIDLHCIKIRKSIVFTGGLHLEISVPHAGSGEDMGRVALQMMKSADKVYDMILLDDDLGATNGDAAPLRGCDIIRLYKLWLEDEISGNVAEKRMLMVNQVVHLYTFGAADKLKRAKLHADDIAWLLRCPFNKPALSQQLEMLDLNNYPRHSDKTT